MIIVLASWLGRLVAGTARLAARWFGLGRSPDGGQRTDDRERPADHPTKVTWDEAERLLAAGLLAGLIEQAEYQECLELLARAEDRRSPLQVPSLRGR